MYKMLIVLYGVIFLCFSISQKLQFTLCENARVSSIIHSMFFFFLQLVNSVFGKEIYKRKFC